MSWFNYTDHAFLFTGTRDREQWTTIANVREIRTRQVEESYAFEAALRAKLLLLNPNRCQLSERECSTLFFGNMFTRPWPACIAGEEAGLILPFQWLCTYCSPNFVGRVVRDHCFDDIISENPKPEVFVHILDSLRPRDADVAREIGKLLSPISLHHSLMVPQMIRWALANSEKTGREHAQRCSIVESFAHIGGAAAEVSQFAISQLPSWVAGVGCDHCWGRIMGDRGPRITSRPMAKRLLAAFSDGDAHPQRLVLAAGEFALCRPEMLESKVLRKLMNPRKPLCEAFGRLVLSPELSHRWNGADISKAKMLALCGEFCLEHRALIADFGGQAHRLPFDQVANRINTPSAIYLASKLDMSLTCKMLYSRYPSLLVVYAKQIMSLAGVKGMAIRFERKLHEFLAEFDRAIARVKPGVRDEMQQAINVVRTTLGPTLWKWLLQSLVVSIPTSVCNVSGGLRAFRLLRKKKGKAPREGAQDGYADELALQLREIACEPLAMGRSEKFSPDSPLNLLDDHTCSLIFDYAFIDCRTKA